MKHRGNVILPTGHELYNADLLCEHELVFQWSGYTCGKCGGWYCA